MITAEFPEVPARIPQLIPIANIEDEQKFVDSSLIQTMAKIIEVLPSLEV